VFNIKRPSTELDRSWRIRIIKIDDKES
jgi:hypothetical protein